MPAQNMAIITPAQRAALMSFNNEDVAISPRAVNNANPGTGHNTNPDAVGDAITLTGNFVAPKRIVDDEQYQTYAPGMVALLRTLPWCVLESDTIFAPVIDG